MYAARKIKPSLAVIDGGPKQVYAPHLKPRLLELREARGLDSQSPLPVDLLMVSHVTTTTSRGSRPHARAARAAGTPFVRIRRCAQQLR
jgi:hypothetical protein